MIETRSPFSISKHGAETGTEYRIGGSASRWDWALVVQRPSLRSILLGLIPFAAVCFPVSLWDRIYPMVLGLPFNFFWLTSWLVLTPLCMWGAYRLEAPRSPDLRRDSKGCDL